MRRQQGASLISTIVTIIVIALIAYAGYHFYMNRQANTETVTVNVDSTDAPATDTTATN